MSELGRNFVVGTAVTGTALTAGYFVHGKTVGTWISEADPGYRWYGPFGSELGPAAFQGFLGCMELALVALVLKCMADLGGSLFPRKSL